MEFVYRKVNYAWRRLQQFYLPEMIKGKLNFHNYEEKLILAWLFRSSVLHVMAMSSLMVSVASGNLSLWKGDKGMKYVQKTL
jgi:hypothetical protein